MDPTYAVMRYYSISFWSETKEDPREQFYRPVQTSQLHRRLMCVEILEEKSWQLVLYLC